MKRKYSRLTFSGDDKPESSGLTNLQTYGSIVLHGWDEIAAYLRVSLGSATCYYKKRGLPVGYIGRHPVTSTALLDRWLMMQTKHYYGPKAGGKYVEDR